MATIAKEYQRLLDFPGGSVGKNSPAMQETETGVISPGGREDPLEEEIATHSSILAWRIPWTKVPGGLQSVGSQRVGRDLGTGQEHIRG